MTAVAAMAGAALAVESKNVVGFLTSGISGYAIKTPTFVNTDGTAYAIDNFVVKNANDGMTTIQVVGTDGQVAGTYYWYNEFNDNGTIYPAGWFDVSGLIPAEVTLAAGDAVFFNTDESGVEIQSRGEVPGEITHSLVGYMMLGNGSPVNLQIDDFAVSGASDGMTTIQIVDAAGQVSANYYWYNEFNDNGTIYPAGWFDVSGLVPAGVTLAPGEGVFFNTDESGVSVTIPAAL